MRLLFAMEKQNKAMALPGRKMVKKRKIILSGMMVGPITEDMWGDDWKHFKKHRSEQIRKRSLSKTRKSPIKKTQ